MRWAWQRLNSIRMVWFLARAPKIHKWKFGTSKSKAMLPTSRVTLDPFRPYRSPKMVTTWPLLLTMPALNCGICENLKIFAPFNWTMATKSKIYASITAVLTWLSPVQTLGKRRTIFYVFFTKSFNFIFIFHLIIFFCNKNPSMKINSSIFFCAILFLSFGWQDLFVQTMAGIMCIQWSYIIRNWRSIRCECRLFGVHKYGSYSEILRIRQEVIFKRFTHKTQQTTTLSF